MEDPPSMPEASALEEAGAVPARFVAPQHRFLVYTCAGERSGVARWLQGPRNFDLWVNDYGHQGDRHRALADHHTARAGKKFPNLAHFARAHPGFLAQYEAVFVADDDLVIDAAGISRLFEIREEHDLWLLQPAFLSSGRISHPITRAQPGRVLRWTNFVECVCPLFRRDKLEGFLEVYDPVVVGWGVDWWYLDHLGPDLRGKVAVVDAVPCENPHHEKKGSEPEHADPRYARFRRDLQQAAWVAHRDRLGIASEARGCETYGGIWDAATDTWWRRLGAFGPRALADFLWEHYRRWRTRGLGLVGRGPAGSAAVRAALRRS